MKAPKELVLKATTTTNTEATASLAKLAKGVRPMKSMMGVKSFRPRSMTQAASTKTEFTTEAR